MSFAPFPEQWELIGLFECEPTLSDQGIPWCYNRLAFETQRGEDLIRCKMSPASHKLEFEWLRAAIAHLAIDLRWEQGITVKMSDGVEALQLHFPGDSDIESIELQLKPTIRCVVVNSKEHF